MQAQNVKKDTQNPRHRKRINTFRGCHTPLSVRTMYCSIISYLSQQQLILVHRQKKVAERRTGAGQIPATQAQSSQHNIVSVSSNMGGRLYNDTIFPKAPRTYIDHDGNVGDRQGECNGHGALVRREILEDEHLARVAKHHIAYR